MQQVQYSAVPLDEPNPDNSYKNISNGLIDLQQLGPLPNNGNVILRGDPRYREELDFDGSGDVDEFEIYFAGILDAAKEGRKIPLTDDVWGVAIYSTVSDLPAILACDFSRENILRFAYVTLMGFVNLTLQFGLLYWISIYVMFPSMRETQEVYYNYHRDVYSPNGNFLPAKFLTFDGAHNLCQFPFFDRFFTAAVLFLWTSQCFIEIRSSERIFSALIALPSLPWGISYKLMIHEGLHDSDSNVTLAKIENSLTSLEATVASNDVQQLTEVTRRMLELIQDKYTDENTSRYLVCLTQTTRLSIFVLVLFPRMIIILSVMTMGCIWLTATDRFDSLILNALALEFVVNVDNLLYTMFFPVSIHSKVENMKVAIPGGSSASRMTQVSSEPNRREPSDVSGICRSFFYLVLVISFVLAFQSFQPVLPGFKEDLDEPCEPFVEAWSSPRYGFDRMSRIFACMLNKEECFPYGNPGQPTDK
jgi:hypothetical protein